MHCNVHHKKEIKAEGTNRLKLSFCGMSNDIQSL